MVAPGGIIGAAQIAREGATAGAKSPAKTLKVSSRLQGILEAAGQEVWMMKELQSQKAGSVVQMVLKLLSSSHYRDLQSSRHSRRIRVRTKEILGERPPPICVLVRGLMTDRAGSSGGTTLMFYHAHAQVQRIRCGDRDSL